jgi:hypothetical protein
MSALSQTLFSTGETLTQSVLNANPSALLSWSNSIDNSNIGSAGLFATNLKPTTGAQATFGGSVAYTFPAGVLATQSGTAGYCAPVYTSAGAATSSTQKMVSGTSTFQLSLGLSYLSSPITLTNAAIFSNATSYTVLVTGPSTTVSTTAGFVPVVASLVSQASGNVFTLAIETANGLTNNSSNVPITVTWLAIGT